MNQRSISSSGTSLAVEEVISALSNRPLPKLFFYSCHWMRCVSTGSTMEVVLTGLQGTYSFRDLAICGSVAAMCKAD